MACITVRLADKTVRRVELDVDLLLVGRGSDAHVEIDHDLVSRKHCRLREVGDGFVVEDLGSKTGTFVNGTRVNSHLLEAGDVVSVGPYSILFEEGTTGSAPAATAAADQNQEDFWADAAADSGLVTKAAPQPAATGQEGAKAESAASLAQSLGGGADMDDYQGTMEASVEQIERLRQLLALESQAHLSVKTDEELKRLPVGSEFTVGHFEGADFRLPGSRWFGKVQFRVHKMGDDEFRAEPGGFFSSVQLDGKKLKGSQPLKDGARIAASGLTFRFKLGS